MSLKVEKGAGGIIFKIRVRPSAPRSRIKGFYGEVLKVDISESPVKDKANRECIKFLAQKLKIPKCDVEIISGLKSRDKLIQIKGISKDKLLQVLCPKVKRYML